MTERCPAWLWVLTFVGMTEIRCHTARETSSHLAIAVQKATRAKGVGSDRLSVLWQVLREWSGRSTRRPALHYTRRLRTHADRLPNEEHWRDCAPKRRPFTVSYQLASTALLASKHHATIEIYLFRRTR